MLQCAGAVRGAKRVQRVHPDSMGDPLLCKQLQVQARTSAIRAGPRGLTGHSTWPWPRLLRGAALPRCPMAQTAEPHHVLGRPITHEEQPPAKILGGRGMASLSTLRPGQRLCVPATHVGHGTVSSFKHACPLASAWSQALWDRTGSATAGDVPGAGRRQRLDPGVGERCCPQPLPSPGRHRGHRLLPVSHRPELAGAAGAVGGPMPRVTSPTLPTSPSQPYILLHMPIWSRPALWNVKKYVFLGWDPHAGNPPMTTTGPGGACGEMVRPWGW